MSLSFDANGQRYVDKITSGLSMCKMKAAGSEHRKDVLQKMAHRNDIHGVFRRQLNMYFFTNIDRLQGSPWPLDLVLVSEKGLSISFQYPKVKHFGKMCTIANLVSLM